MLAAVLLAGCRPAFELDGSGARDAKPHANAGVGTTIDYRSTIMLDGSASLDPDGALVEYRWTLDEAPDASTATIADPSAATTSLVPDTNGKYSFTLQVTDSGGNTDSSSVVYLVTAGPLMIDAGPDLAVEWRKTAQLSAFVQVTSGMTPVIEWTLVSRPPRSSTVLQGASTLTPSFVADVAGVYELQLVVTSEEHVRTDTVTVTAAPNRVEFQGAFIDAVMSIEDSTLIAISDAPPRLRFLHVPTAVETTIPLPSTPTAITLDDNDNQVAVAISGEVRIFDLVTKSQSASFAVPSPVADLVFARSRVHAFPVSTGPIQTYDVAAQIVEPTTYSVSGSSAAHMTPGSSTDMFSIDTSVTPADLYHYNVSDTPATLISDSPYAGEYPLGNDLWIIGRRIVVSTGHVFVSDPFEPPDMFHESRLTTDPSTRLNSLLWAANIYTLETTAGLVDFRVYDGTTFAPLRSYAVPDIVVNGTAQTGQPRLVTFLNPDKILLVTSFGTSNMIVITQ